MVLVEVRSVVVLTTSQTSTTWMLAVLSYTTVSGGDVAAAVEITEVSNPFFLSFSLSPSASNSPTAMPQCHNPNPNSKAPAQPAGKQSHHSIIIRHSSSSARRTSHTHTHT
jgi:hypothetical protein